MITPQSIFMILGVVAFALSALMLAIALVYYFRNDIRGVKDDLSGKARRVGQTEQRYRPRGGTLGRSASGQSRAGIVQEQEALDGPAAGSQPAEDDLETVLDTQLRAVPQEFRAVSSDGHGVNDDIPTLVTSMDDYHRIGVSEDDLNDAEMPTVVEDCHEELSSGTRSAVDQGSPSFVVTKGILALHSSEIIVAD